MSATDVVVVLVTAPSAEAASTLAELLVAERLAACVSVVPGVTSVYRWQGAVERATEHLLVIKTTRAGTGALTARVQATHPYDVPEVIALPVTDGLPAYLRWVADQVGSADDDTPTPPAAGHT